METDQQKFKNLFEGFQGAHGTYDISVPETGNSGKLTGRAKTIKRVPTDSDWNAHLSGQIGLGIIPITAKSTVKFAAIDVDKYPLDLGELNKKIQKLPLVLCRTKSGGAHLYLFMRDYVDAELVVARIRQMAASLGYGACEIFPKQSKILVERGDMGQWINLPYFNLANNQRYALNGRGNPLDLTEFLAYVETKKVTKEQLENLDIRIPDILPGGPPCLNYLCSIGFPNGTRNNGLFNLGVYARMSNKENWQAKVESFNNEFMDPPLDSNEVLGVLKSLQKKDFSYMCSQQPISSFCERNKCRACEFGIGGGIGMPVFGSLTKVMTDPPTWFLEIDNGGRMEVSTEDLQNPRRFQLRCMETMNIMPQLPNAVVWTQIVQKLLMEVKVVEVPEDASHVGQLRGHLMEFCTSRVQAKAPEELVMGKPYTSGGKHYFRLKDFLAYLDRQRVRYEQRQVVFLIKDILKSEHKFFNIKGKGVNTYVISEFVEAKQGAPFDQIDQERQVPM